MTAVSIIGADYINHHKELPNQMANMVFPVLLIVFVALTLLFIFISIRCKRQSDSVALELNALKRESEYLIVQRRQAASDLNEEKERAQKYLQIAGVIFVSLDRYGNITLINKKGLHLLGYQEEKELIGKNWFDVCIPDRMRAKVSAVFRQLIAGETEPFEYFENSVLTKDGQERIIAWHNSVIENDIGDITEILSSGEDITDRLLAEAALLDREERIRGIADAAADSIFCKNRDSKYTFVNPAMAKVFGCDVSDLIGKTPSDLFDPETAALINSIDQDTFSGKTVEAVRTITVNKTLHTFHSIQTPLYDQNREIKEICGIVRDITALKQAEDALRHQEELFRIIFDMALDMICIADIGTATFIKINPSFNRVLGYSEQELLAHPFLDFIHPDDIRHTVDVIERDLKFGVKVLIFENRYRCKDGSYRWLSWTSHPIPEKMITFAIARDITDRKEMEISLRESEERFRMLVESINIGIFMTRPDGKIVLTNSAMAEMSGYDTVEEMMETPAQNLYVDKSDRKRFIRNLKENGHVKNMEVRCVRMDGATYWALVSAVLLKDRTGTLLILGSSQDITFKKTAEDAIRESEKKYRALYSEMTEGVCLHELIFDDSDRPSDYRIIDVNPAYEAITGISKEKVIGTKASEIYGLGVPPYFDIYTAVVLTGKSANFETYFSPMNKHFFVSVFSPAPEKFATVFSDITERKQAEVRLAKLNQELMEKNTELEQIVYVASHDLRSPLVNIQGFSRELRISFDDLFELISAGSMENIREKLNSYIKSDILESLEFIFKSTAKMDLLLSGLLRLSRLGRMAMTIQKINMNEFMSDVIKTFEYKIKQNNTSVRCEDLPDCCADIIMLNQVFSNLIDNAIKFMSSERTGTIRISGFAKNDETVYCIEDNGMGINPNYHDKIFELFHRLDPKTDGEGLGLTIIRKIMEKHNGKIRVESDVGKGSKFFVSFPMMMTA